MHYQCAEDLMQIWDSHLSQEHRHQFTLGLVVSATAENDMKSLDKWLTVTRGSLSQIELEEALLQTLLFVGFPRTIEALNVLRNHYPEITDSRKPEDIPEAGRLICRTIYAERFPRLISAMDKLHPDLTSWILEDGYGRVLSRHGLEIADRELCVLVALMASGMERQYRAHLRGSLNVGVSVDDINWFTSSFECIIPPEKRNVFKSVMNEIMYGQMIEQQGTDRNNDS